MGGMGGSGGSGGRASSTGGGASSTGEGTSVGGDGCCPAGCTSPSDSDCQPVVTAITAGTDHTCALLSNGGVKCWGANSAGQLGSGSADSPVPVDVQVLGPGFAAVAVAAGGHNTCAVSAAGSLKCWGDSSWAQAYNQASGALAVKPALNHTCFLTSAGGVRCAGQNAYGQLGNGSTIAGGPVDVQGLTSGVQAVTTGRYLSCGLTTAGGVKCWGHFLGAINQNNNLVPFGVSNLAAGVAAIAVGGNATDHHLCALTTAKAVKCLGANDWGQVGDTTYQNQAMPVTVAFGVKAITAGTYHTCALTTGGGVTCWGANQFGQGGNGYAKINYPTPVTGLADGSGVSAIVAGDMHTCALLSTGHVKCWGANGHGQLGNNTVQQSSPIGDVVGL